MKRFVEGVDRGQSTLFPECLDDWIDADNPVRVIDVFVESLISVRSISAGSIRRRQGDPRIIPRSS
jgi:transposase